MAIKLLTTSGLLSASGGNYLSVDASNLSYPANEQASTGWINFNAATRTLNVTFSANANQTGIMLYIRNAYIGVLTIKLFEGAVERTSDTFDFAANPLSVNGQGVFPGWHYFPLTSYAVTTAGSTWSYTLSCTSITPTALVTTSSGTDYLYMAVTDSSTTKITSSDTLVISDGITLTVDESVTHADQGNGFCIIQCYSSVYQVTNAALSAPITITIGAKNYWSSTSQFIIGSQAAPITVANRVTIDFSGGTLTNFFSGASSTSYWGLNVTAGIEFWGAEDTHIGTRIVATAASGQADIVTTQDMSDEWAIGDELSLIGKRIVTDTVISYTISNIVGTTITLSANLDQPLLEGGAVVNADRKDECGIWLTGTATQYLLYPSGRCGHIQVVGTRLLNIGVTSTVYAVVSRKLKNVIVRNVLFDTTGLISGLLIGGNSSAVISGYYHFYRRNTYGSGIFFSTYGNNMTVENVYTKSTYGSWAAAISNGMSAPIAIHGNGNTASGLVFSGGRSSATAYTAMTFSGAGNTISDVFIYAPFAYPLNIFLVNSTLSDLTIDRSGAYDIYNYNSVGLTIADAKLGTVDPAVSGEILGATDSLHQTILTNPTIGASVTNLMVGMDLAVPGSYLRIQDYNGTDRDCRGYEVYGNYVSTGTGLDDTTVHTAGGFAYRQESINSESRFEWTFYLPTGNIEDKTMIVGVWCKINSATYYAGTHRLPRVNVTYDNTTTVYAEAVESTEWQFLNLPFTPTTSYGQVTVTLYSRTDATGSDAYVYFDDFSVLYPAGYQLDLGSMDLWANALPITPPIATNLSAQSIWAAADNIDYGANTFGNRVKKLKNPSLVIDGEVIV